MSEEDTEELQKQVSWLETIYGDIEKRCMEVERRLRMQQEKVSALKGHQRNDRADIDTHDDRIKELEEVLRILGPVKQSATTKEMALETRIGTAQERLNEINLDNIGSYTETRIKLALEALDGNCENQPF